MYLSKYNALVEDFPFEGGVTIYNLITKGLAYVEDKEYLGNLKEIDDDTLLHMKDNKMVFSSADDEESFINEFMADKYRTEDKLEITLVTSHACNLKCIYCFEGESSNEHLTMQKADEIINEIMSVMAEDRNRELTMRYYGGEPMTNLPVIDYINARLFAEYGERYSFSIVTNGVLLTKEIIEKWASCNWKGIKITLDGDREWTDSRRIAKDGISTYNRVLNNLTILPENIEVFLHIVVDDSNIDHLDHMFEDLADRGLQERIVIGISYTHPHINVQPEHRAQIVLKATQKAKQYGFFLTNLISIDGEGICPNKNHNAYLIDIDGKKLKCTGFMSMKDCPEGFYRGSSDKYNNMDSQCLKCKYLPVCNGGCQFLKVYNKGNKYCQRQYFDALIPELLKIYIDYEVE